jgi:hypothetical protein
MVMIGGSDGTASSGGDVRGGVRRWDDVHVVGTKAILNVVPTPTPTALATPLPVRGMPITVSSEPTSIPSLAADVEGRSSPSGNSSTADATPEIRGRLGTETLICSLSWPCDTALRIAECESRFDPNAISWDGQDFGLFQIRASVWRYWLDERGFSFWDEWMIPEKNVAMAHLIYQERGWRPWTCAR